MKKATIRYCCNALIMGVAVFACGIFAETSVKAEGTPETVPPIESAAPQVMPEVSAGADSTTGNTGAGSSCETIEKSYQS